MSIDGEQWADLLDATDAVQFAVWHVVFAVAMVGGIIYGLAVRLD